MTRNPTPFRSRLYVAWLALVAIGLVSAVGWMSTREPGSASAGVASSGGLVVGGVSLWEPLLGTKFNTYEKIALVTNVVIALAGLAYAANAGRAGDAHPQGTEKIQEIAQAVREGANAYLYRQFSVVFVLIVVITVLLFYGAKASGFNVQSRTSWSR